MFWLFKLIHPKEKVVWSMILRKKRAICDAELSCFLVHVITMWSDVKNIFRHPARKHDDHAISEHSCFLNIKIRKWDTKKSNLLTHKMKWFIALQSLKIFAFGTRQQCLHRVTLMSYTQHSNLLPLLTAGQGYLLEQNLADFRAIFQQSFPKWRLHLLKTERQLLKTVCFLFIY